MIVVEDLHIRVGTFSLKGINLCVPTSRYSILMGRTGSGKTTIMEAICGLRPVISGHILLDGRDVTRLRPAERGIGYVPQDAALFTSMTVYEHIAYALRLRNWSGTAIEKHVRDMAEMVGVSHLLERKPLGLSGGEMQRVALGRALSFRPQILCLDEPLSSLDDESRDELIELLKRIQTETAVTALHVTHNRAEAEMLANHWLELKDDEVREHRRDAAMTEVDTSSEAG